MTTHTLSIADRLSDHDLVAHVKRLARRERDAAVELIIHLAVLEERGLYLSEGCSSMFTYCISKLHLAEHATLNRIEAARAARKFPIIFEMLADGSVNLTTVRLVAPHLTPQNHVELLRAAAHKRKNDVLELLATIRPQPSVPPSIRKLPTPREDPQRTAPETDRPAPAASNETETTQARSEERVGEAFELQAAVSAGSPRHKGTIAPLAPSRYRVQLTVNAELRAKILRAQNLLRHQIPDGNLEKVIDRAVTALLEQLERRKTASTDRPVRKAKESNPNSRHIPAGVKRAVWVRDGGRCVFVGADGHRCNELGFLEFHHVVPYSAGGQATVDNIQLRCRAHNGYEAERYFGKQSNGFVKETYAAVYGQIPTNSFWNEFVEVSNLQHDPGSGMTWRSPGASRF